MPARSVQELIALAKEYPGKLNYPSAGKGTNSHLSMELFKTMTGTNIVNVPYRGGGPGQMALLAGEVDVGFNNRCRRAAHQGGQSASAGNHHPEALFRGSSESPTIAGAGVPGYRFTT